MKVGDVVRHKELNQIGIIFQRIPEKGNPYQNMYLIYWNNNIISASFDAKLEFLNEHR
tara:strand:+ start:17067 stop:17240 length:174 start_codon:yes stop_codon:yes gene_type:complete